LTKTKQTSAVRKKNFFFAVRKFFEDSSPFEVLQRSEVFFAVRKIFEDSSPFEVLRRSEVFSPFENFRGQFAVRSFAAVGSFFGVQKRSAAISVYDIGKSSEQTKFVEENFFCDNWVIT
jgi:Golgi nucleoside diphosphatase